MSTNSFAGLGIPPGKLCGRLEPVFRSVLFEPITNCTDSAFFAISIGTELFNSYQDSLRNHFDSRYRARCLEAYKFEKFTVRHEVSQYHFTLYYYDQAGNLIKTVPPAGVVPNYDSLWLESVEAARAQKQVVVPPHQLVTNYRYNTLNQVVSQRSPDGGTSNFWYDRLGRLSISQNAKQYYSGITDTSLFSYTLYDALGRITEVGELKKHINTPITDSISRNIGLLETWVTAAASSKRQITNTVYDIPYPGFVGISPTPLVQRHLRNRVSYTSFTAGSNVAQYNHSTFFSYDIHGNVDTLLQDFGSSSLVATANMMNSNGNQYKKMVYQYDLISGKVNMVHYQPGYRDMLIHKYSYDAENRLTLVESSEDSVIWQKDARYEYYKHGPLARVVLGDQLVQGTDYAYTLQGWLKGVNSTALNPDHDMGQDGKSGNQNQYIAKDAIGFNLGYFYGDYSSINSNSTPFPAHHTASEFRDRNKRPLYNGNISSMAMSISTFSSGTYFGGRTMLYAYSYDQLNRLKGMDAYNDFDHTANNWNSLDSVNSDEYKEVITYDPNGNILKYLRHGNIGGGSQRMDSLNYYYYANSNKLKRVSDNVPSGRYGFNGIPDLENQSNATNYIYDSIGNLISDAGENITNIKWSVYGKILEITRTPTTALPVTKITYTYDANGNRIGQVIEKNGTSTKDYVSYVRDAQGNILAVYKASGSGTLASLFPNIEERMLYGSSRLGSNHRAWGVNEGPQELKNFNSFTFQRGRRRYELSNHLGNIIATITDRKYGVPTAGTGSPISYYNADVYSATDYYPFGSIMPGRTVVFGAQYRFGFNGKENDNEVKGPGNQQDYGMRIYDSRIGRFLSLDPLVEKYPWYSPYQFAGNKPTWAIDLDGLEEYHKNGIPYGYMHNSPPVGKSYSSSNFSWTILDQKYVGDDGDFRVTKLRILDANKNHYFVKKMERMVTTRTSFGPITTREVKWSYNQEAPRLKSDPKPYLGAPQYLSFETSEQIESRQNIEVADGIGKFFFLGSSHWIFTSCGYSNRGDLIVCHK